MSAPIDNRQWLDIVHKLKRHAFVQCKPSVRKSNDGITITNRIWPRIVGFVILIIGIAGIGLIVKYIIPERHIPWEGEWIISKVGLCVIGAVVLGFGILVLTARWRIYLRPYANELRIIQRTFIKTTDMVIPSGELCARMYINTEKEGSRWIKEGRAVLTLFKEGQEDANIYLAVLESRESLLPALDALKTILKDRVYDDTLMEHQLPNGGKLVISKAPINITGANFRTCKLNFPDENTAIISRSFWLISFLSGFFIIGIYLLLTNFLECYREIDSLLSCLLGAAFVLFGGGQLWGFGVHRVCFDRLRNIITIRRGIFSKNTNQIYSFHDI
ncbi:MAG: hypothetical protein JSV03_05105, partial [Planctomycetota bacterium]